MSLDEVQKQFDADVAGHALTVIRDDGVYRHLRFRRPGTGVNGFDIVTWPGHLAFTGDMGCYVFARVDDMLTFFRECRPNPSYWSEKCLAPDKYGDIQEFDEEAFKQAVKDDFETWCESRDIEGDERAELWERVESEVISAGADGYEAAVRAASEFEDDDGRDVFPDFWEHDLTDWTFRFLWCCCALPWAVAQYDAWRAAQEAAPAPAGPGR